MASCQSHRGDAHLASFQHERGQLVGGEAVECRKRGYINAWISRFLSDVLGMLGVCRHSFKSERYKRAERADVLVLGSKHADRLGFREHLVKRPDGKHRGIVRIFDVCAGKQVVAQVEQLVNLRLERVAVKVGVCYSHEKAVEKLVVDFTKLINIEIAFFDYVADASGYKV